MVKHTDLPLNIDSMLMDIAQMGVTSTLINYNDISRFAQCLNKMNDLDKERILKDLQKQCDVIYELDYELDDKEVLEAIENMAQIVKRCSDRIKDREYGVFMGRFQPFHKGHQKIIDEIIKDDKEPIILIGSINQTGERHPLTFEQRKELISVIYNIHDIIGIEDFEDWTQWKNNVISVLSNTTDLSFGAMKEKVTIYVSKKEEDCCTFECDGKVFENCHYIDIFKELGFNIKEVDPFTINGDIIHATEIRKSKDYAKRVMNECVFEKYIKMIENN